MTGEDHGRARAGVALQHPADGLRGHRVDALERLVEEEHLGVVQQRGRQSDLLAHPGRVVHDQLVLGPREIQDVEQLGGPLVHLGARQAAQPSRVAEEFTAGEALEEPQPLREHPDPGLHLDRVPPHVVAADLDAAHVGPQQPGHHGERGGLPRAVGAHQADEPAGGQLQVDPSDRDLLAEPLPQSLHPHGRGWRRNGPRHVGPARAVRLVRHGTAFRYPRLWGPPYERRLRASAASRAQAYASGLISSSASGSHRLAREGRRAHCTAPRPASRVGGPAT